MNPRRIDITRANCHFQTPDVYCGRRWKGFPASALGNPFRVGDDRGDAIDRYGRWLWRQIRRRDPAVLAVLRQIRAHLLQHGTVSLGCWCHEQYRCHTDTIANAILCPEVLAILDEATPHASLCDLVRSDQSPPQGQNASGRSPSHAAAQVYRGLD